MWGSGPVWTGAENLAPPGFDSRTVQSVGSRYTDYATRPTNNKGNLKKKIVRFFLSDLITFPVTFPAPVAAVCRAVVIMYFAYVVIQKLCILSAQRPCS